MGSNIKKVVIVTDRNDSYENEIVQISVECNLATQEISFIREKGKLFYTIPKNLKEAGRLKIYLPLDDMRDFIQSWLDNIRSLSKITYIAYSRMDEKPDDRKLKDMVSVTNTFRWNKLIVIRQHYNSNLSITLQKDQMFRNHGSSKEIKICPLKKPLGMYGHSFYLMKYHIMTERLEELREFIE